MILILQTPSLVEEEIYFHLGFYQPNSIQIQAGSNKGSVLFVCSIFFNLLSEGAMRIFMLF
ncbi:hypothetical protein J2Z23_004089 [Lederbergia galactosidilyticus]|nr:hypothetical protein [Lederbergia galactosidilytica]